MAADSQCDRLSLQRLGLQHLPLLNQSWLEALKPLLLQQLLNQGPQLLKQLLIPQQAASPPLAVIGVTRIPVFHQLPEKSGKRFFQITLVFHVLVLLSKA